MKQAALEKLSRINNHLNGKLTPHDGILGGQSGLTYYYHYAAHVLGDRSLQTKANESLRNIFTTLNEGGGRLAGNCFSAGGAGFAFAVSHLAQHQLLEFDVDAEFEDLDHYLFEEAKEQLRQGEVDYLHGGMGPFFYFASRQKKTDIIIHYLNELFQKLMDNAVWEKGGVWFPNFSLQRITDKHIDFSLAHGLSGILLLVIEAWPYLKNKKAAHKLLKCGLNFILQCELPTGERIGNCSKFPSSLERDAKSISASSRLAWCYGDLNQALLFHRAGLLLGEGLYIDKATETGIASTKRKTEAETLSSDAHFCHGSAGLAQFYKCLYHETLQYPYYKAYEYWMKQTIQQVDGELNENKYAVNPGGLLDAWTGIAFVLLEYVSAKRLHWSKAFLL